MISLKNISLRRGTKLVLDGISTTIHPGEHVGLIGRNGAGKSSLFALLAGRLHEDGGEFFIPAQWRMAEVAQHLPDTDESATAFVTGHAPWLRYAPTRTSGQIYLAHHCTTCHDGAPGGRQPGALRPAPRRRYSSSPRNVLQQGRREDETGTAPTKGHPWKPI